MIPEYIRTTPTQLEALPTNNYSVSHSASIFPLQPDPYMHGSHNFHNPYLGSQRPRDWYQHQPHLPPHQQPPPLQHQHLQQPQHYTHAGPPVPGYPRHDSISSTSSNGSPGEVSSTSSSSSMASNASDQQSPQGKKRRGNLPRQVTDILRSWLNAHVQHPYPTDEEKAELMKQTGLTLNQISNWFINARRRRLPAMHRNK